MNGRVFAWFALLGCVAMFGCVPDKTAHDVNVNADTKHEVEIKPIHITIDVNIKVDRQLDDFFDFEEEEKSGS